MHTNSQQETHTFPRLVDCTNSPTEGVAVRVHPTHKLATTTSGRNRLVDRDIQRVQAALETVARLVVRDSTYVPIMERLENDLVQMREKAACDPVQRAMALIQRKAVS